ncbi:hypothetical protein B7463_g4483, partial [Scytalidium lignicola]
MTEQLILKGTLEGHSGWVTSLATSLENPNMLLSGSRDKTLIIWNLTRDETSYGYPKRSLHGHSHIVSDCVISSDGAYALSASWDKTLRLWELSTGTTTRRFVGHTNDVLSVSFSADNRQIVSGSRDRSIKLWNTLGDCKFTITEKGHSDWVSCVRFSPNPQNPVIVSSGWDKLVKVWELSSCRLQTDHIGHTGYINTVTISPDGSLCASGGKDGTTMLWDLNESKHLYSLNAGDEIHALVFSPNRYWLCAATSSSIIIFDLEKKSKVDELKPEFQAVGKKSREPECVDVKKLIMCGRYSLALRPSQVRELLEYEDMPVSEAPSDDSEDVPRESYNFAPGYIGLVYRADTPSWGAGPKPVRKGEEHHEQEKPNDTKETEPAQEPAHYKLQPMKWGLIPHWTKRNPDYGSLLKTINCRDDSLIENRGMWNSMKQRKRCIVIAQGFYEWKKKGKERLPYYVKRKDGQLMCIAGLWDWVQYEGSEEKLYTYTIITTSPNKAMSTLHDRMPAVLENNSKDLWTWLNPGTYQWNKDLQKVLKPFEGELEIYAVSKDVNKVGNNSPSFIVPLTSTENKSNIANFFSKSPAKGKPVNAAKPSECKESQESDKTNEIESVKPDRGESETEDHDGLKENEVKDNITPGSNNEPSVGIKRELEDSEEDRPPKKTTKTSVMPKTKKAPISPPNTKRTMRSATKNNSSASTKSQEKGKGNHKITSFLAKK